MAGDAHHPQVRKHFGHLAKHYDQRWSYYVQRTLNEAVEALRISGDATVLDVGCGTGEFERLARERFGDAELIGVDVTPEMVAIAREKCRAMSGVAFFLAEAEGLPVASASVDAVVSCSMLHHVPEPEALLRECARVLRPQGELVIVDWCRDFPHCRAAHYWLRVAKPSYARMYRIAELRRLLEPMGFVVRETGRFFVPPYFGMMRVSATKG